MEGMPPVDSPRFSMELLSLPSVAGERSASGSSSVVLILPRKETLDARKVRAQRHSQSQSTASLPISQETKMSRTVAIRRNVAGRMRRQAAADFAYVVKVRVQLSRVLSFRRVQPFLSSSPSLAHSASPPLRPPDSGRHSILQVCAGHV